MTTAYDQTHRFVQSHGAAVVSRRYQAIATTSHRLTLTCSRCQASTEIHVDVYEDMPAIMALFLRKPT